MHAGPKRRRKKTGSVEYVPPSEGAGRRRTPWAPLFPSHSGHSSDRWSSDPGPGGCPARLTQARKTNLRGEAAHAARWGGTGRAPSNPPALGLGGRRGHTRRPRELAGAVGEVAIPCTDGRPPENTPPWLGLHQSSLPNAAKGYPPREPRERKGEKMESGVGAFTACSLYLHNPHNPQ